MEEALLRNRTVREFLGAYSERQWNHVVKCVLLYGIVSLRARYPLRSISVDDLERLLERVTTASVLEDRLPDLEHRVQQLRADLAGVSVSVDPTEPLSLARERTPSGQVERDECEALRHGPEQREREQEQEQEQAQKQEQEQSRRKPKFSKVPNPRRPDVFVKAPGTWRRGDPRSQFSQARAGALYHTPSDTHNSIHPEEERQSSVADALAWHASRPSRLPRTPEEEAKQALMVYPKWWFHKPNPPAPPVNPSSGTLRPPPRLAYIQTIRERTPPLHEDDLVTARYRKVRSSGYGYERGRGAPASAPPPAARGKQRIHENPFRHTDERFWLKTPAAKNEDLKYKPQPARVRPLRPQGDREVMPCCRHHPQRHDSQHTPQSEYRSVPRVGRVSSRIGECIRADRDHYRVTGRVRAGGDVASVEAREALFGRPSEVSGLPLVDDMLHSSIVSQFVDTEENGSAWHHPQPHTSSWEESSDSVGRGEGPVHLAAWHRLQTPPCDPEQEPLDNDTSATPTSLIVEPPTGQNSPPPEQQQEEEEEAYVGVGEGTGLWEWFVPQAGGGDDAKGPSWELATDSDQQPSSEHATRRSAQWVGEYGPSHTRTRLRVTPDRNGNHDNDEEPHPLSAVDDVYAGPLDVVHEVLARARLPGATTMTTTTTES